MNKLIIGAISVIMMLSMTGMANPLSVDINLGIPNQLTSAGNPITVAPAATTNFSMRIYAMSAPNNLYNITQFNITAGPLPWPTLALNYTPKGPILPGGLSSFGFLKPNAVSDYIAPNAFNITIPSGTPNGTVWTFTIFMINETSSDSASVTREVKVFVQPRPPVANFTFIAGACDRKVTFNASSSFDPDGNITNYHWDFGDGLTDDRATNASFIHNYTSGGNKIVNLTVTDNNGNTNFTVKNIFVNDPPTASLIANKTSVNIGGEWVEFDASGSSDANGDTLTFKWDFNNNLVFNESGDEANAFNNQKVSRNVTADTTVRVQVSDPSGCGASSTASVTINPPCVPGPEPRQSLRIYGEDDFGPGTTYGIENPINGYLPNIYLDYRDPFNPGVIPKDSVTFNPAIILWDADNYPMSADLTNIDEKKFLRVWYEPYHKFNGGLNNPTYHPTIEVESTYMLLDSKHKNPISGSAGQTDFAFPVAEKAGQIGLGSFDGNGDGKPDLVDLRETYGSGTNGGIAIETSYTLGKNQTVQFLDHKLKFLSLQVDPADNKRRFAKVEITYAGNIDDDTTRMVDLGRGDPIARTYFDRHNNPFGTYSKPDRTWYAQLVTYDEVSGTATIIVGKEIFAGTTFYVNSVRYDVPAVFITGDEEFKYITLRTPLPKGSDVPREDSVVSSQWITEIQQDAIIPLDPPFNNENGYIMVDDINIDLYNVPSLQVSPFPGDKNTNVADRLVEICGPTRTWYRSETIEPRYHSFLEELLAEEGPDEFWTWKHVRTKPDQYTEFVLPTRPEIEKQYMGDYLVTLSFYANNSNRSVDHIRSPNGMPRAVFVFDAELNETFDPLLNHTKDLYINDRDGAATVRIYGEDDIGPGETANPIQVLGPKIYTNYDDPFDPADIPKDSITFNPAIIQWNGSNWPMSADSSNADVKKYLRMWYEPNHTYNGIRNNPTYHPTIEVESTYMLIDSKHKMPILGSAGSTVFAFPIAEKDGQIGLGSFDGNGDGTPDLVDLAMVSGSGTGGTIGLEHTFNMGMGDTVQFLDHKLKLEGLSTDPSSGKTYATVRMIYAGNLADELSQDVVSLGKLASDPTAKTFFDRHNNPSLGPAPHPYGTWYAKLELYNYDRTKAQITVGKEISAGDTFYVNSVRYDVPAVYVVYTTGKEEFKYITLRTPLPKGSDIPSEQSVVTSQWITEVQPNTPLPVDPPFNMEHYIVDDINTPHNEKPEPLLPNVVDRIIGSYPPLDVQYVSETFEPRYRTNLLEILRETVRERDTVEDWYYYNISTLPIKYTEFKLPPDLSNRNKALRNDYLITLSWLAPNSEESNGWVHDIEDDSLTNPYDERVAFVFDAIDSTGLYVNELKQNPPGTPNQAPIATFTVNSPVQALDIVTANPAGTYDPDSDPITLTWNWGDGTTMTTTNNASVMHSYNRHGTYTVTLNVSDGIHLSNAARTVQVTNDGAKISFRQGWNQISTPITTSNPAGVVLANVSGYVQTWKWDRATQKYVSSGGEPLVAGQGYFVAASGSSDVTIKGTGSILSYSDLNIQAGWKMVGPGLDSISTPVWAYHWSPSAINYETTKNLDPSKGYWILG